MPHIDTDDGQHVIHTHYTDQGAGEPVLLLHGGLESGAAWDRIAGKLAGSHRVLRPDRRGHGRTPDVPGPYAYEAMARETLSFIERAVDAPVHLIGYSDGGNSALLAALERPDRVRSVVTIGANFHHDGIFRAMRQRFREPDPEEAGLKPMREAYAALSPDGDAHWPQLVRKVCEMAVAGPTLTVDDLKRIAVPVLVIAADDDVIAHSHTVALFEALPDARLAIVPSTSHALPHEAPDHLLQLIRRFLDRREPQRTMPMRKQPAA